MTLTNEEEEEYLNDNAFESGGQRSAKASKEEFERLKKDNVRLT
jgi:hypothetical protein